MELIVKPEGTDLFYQVLFEEPIVDHLLGENLIPTTVKMAKAFGLRLNNVKLNNETPSDNFIEFYIFQGISSFHVSFGLEEASAKLIRPQNKEQVIDLHGKLWTFIESLPVATQKMAVQHQLSSERDIPAFMERLSPRVSAKLGELVHSRGVYFALEVSEHNLRINVTVMPSIIRDDWLFLSIENTFSPNTHSFQDAFKIADEHREFILKELNLRIQEK